MTRYFNYTKRQLRRVLRQQRAMGRDTTLIMMELEYRRIANAA